MKPSPADSGGLLIGNSFPLSLIRSRVVIEPSSFEELKAALRGKVIHSFWGHPNSLAKASELAGVSLEPSIERPELKCDSVRGLPSLKGAVFGECWVLSFRLGYRPAAGAAIPADQIKDEDWYVLRLIWNSAE